MEITPRINIVEEVAAIEKLHGNVAILARLEAILNDPNSALSDAERLINTDGALAATIIKLSNSALYMMGDRRVDVYSALQKVGFNEALRLVGIALSRQVFMKDLVSYGMSAFDYWKESFFVASFMEAASRNVRGINRDRAYLIGLLHGIGKVVINEILLSHKVEILWDPTIPAEEWEGAMVGHNFAEVGAMLLQRWEFPPMIYETVARQLNAGVEDLDSLQALLALGCRVRNCLDPRYRLPAEWCARIPRLLEIEGFDAELIEACSVTAREKVIRVSITLQTMPLSAARRESRTP